MQPEIRADQPKLRSRRRFLIGLALAGTAAGSGAAAAILRQAGGAPDFSEGAYAAWTQTRQDGLTDAEYMVLCAHLAASPHNTQPWRFTVGADHIDVVADFSRNIGLADAVRRQLHQGLGCAVENLVTAAGYLGYETRVVLPGKPLDTGKASIRVILKSLPEGASALVDEAEFAAIFARATNRGAYLPDAPPESLLAGLRKLQQPGVSLRLIDAGTEDAAYVTAALRQASRDLVHDPAVFADSMKWWRADREELLRTGDGISIMTADMPPIVKGGMAKLVSEGMWEGQFGQRGEIGSVDAVVEATPVWGVIAASEVSLDSRIRAGRMLEAVYLAATRAGHHIHPLNYAVEHERFALQLHHRFDLPQDGELLTVFRLGRGEPLEKSPRRDWRQLIG